MHLPVCTKKLQFITKKLKLPCAISYRFHCLLKTHANMHHIRKMQIKILFELKQTNANWTLKRNCNPSPGWSRSKWTLIGWIYEPSISVFMASLYQTLWPVITSTFLLAVQQEKKLMKVMLFLEGDLHWVFTLKLSLGLFGLKAPKGIQELVDTTMHCHHIKRANI